jgi:hypothetical protein
LCNRATEVQGQEGGWPVSEQEETYTFEEMHAVDALLGALQEMSCAVFHPEILAEELASWGAG